jgi:single-strand DNA-binding protein
MSPKGGKIVLNQAVLIGRIVKDPELKATEKGKVTNITLAVPRSFKNQNGEYDTDFISCVLWKGVAESTAEYCKKGDLVGIKGRIQTRDVELEDETHKKYVEVIAEKVTFLSSKRQEEAE